MNRRAVCLAILSAIVAEPYAARAQQTRAPQASGTANLCSQTAELDSTLFYFEFQPKGGGDAVDMSFEPAACYVHDTDADGDAISPEAFRVYHSSYRNFSLFVQTGAGTGASRFSLVQYEDRTHGRFLNSGYLGDSVIAHSRLLSGPVSLNPLAIAAWYPKFEKWVGKGSLSAAQPKCSVRMVDKLNKSDHVLRAWSSPGTQGGTLYKIFLQGDIEQTTLLGDADPIEAHNGVPHPTKGELLQNYKAKASALSGNGRFEEGNGQLIYTVLPGASCTETESSLILFWVDEWIFG